jgi:anti-sigma factor RsiW
VSPHVDPARLASSTGPDRSAMLAHLLECASCRRDVAAHDPSLLFGLLALAPVPEEVLDRVSGEVARRAGSDHPSLGVLAESAGWPRRAAAAAVFILMLWSGYMTLHERPQATPAASFVSQRADVEVDSGRGVSQVIDMTVGETQIVMVYNGDLKL